MYSMYTCLVHTVTLFTSSHAVQEQHRTVIRTVYMNVCVCVCVDTVA